MATVAKAKHREARALYLEHLDLHPGRTVNADLDPLEAGIVGDPDHDGGYHISRQDNDADDYSVDESIRDRRGRSDTASAMDIGYFEIRTRKGTFDLYDYNAWLVGLCKAGDPDTADLREVIYSLDGRTVRRWDRLKRRSTGDSSHRTHTHLSEFRDASGQRMVNLARRWLQHIGLLAGEDDDMPTPQEVTDAVWKVGAREYVDQAGDGERDTRTTLDILFSTHAAAVTGVGQVAALTAVVHQLGDIIQSGGGSVDTAAILAGVDQRVSALEVDIRDIVADLGEGGAAQVRAGSE